MIAKYLLIPAMAWLSRMCGGAPPKTPVDQWIYAIPFAVNVYMLFEPVHGWRLCSTLEWATVILAYFAAFVMKRIGHGGSMDLDHSPKEVGAGREPEFLERPFLWLYGKVSDYWYDFIVHSFNGLLIMAVPAVAHAYYGSGLNAAVLAASGAMKGPGYGIGWWLYDREFKKGYVDSKGRMTRYPKYLNEATAIGELLTGLFNGIGLTLTM